MNATVAHGGKSTVFYDCDPEDFIERGLLNGQWYELANLEYIHSLKVKGTYVDVGAFVGTHSVFFMQFCECRRLIAVEPQQASYDKLVRNLSGVRNQCEWEAINCALSDAVGRCRIQATKGNRGGAQAVEGEETIVSTLDRKVTREPVHLLKIDVEGRELPVLEGGRKLLACDSLQHVFVEQWTEAICREYHVPFTRPQVAELLGSFGFRMVKELESDLFHFART